jgi:hypothetical protein
MSTFFHSWFINRAGSPASVQSGYGRLPLRAHQFLKGVPLRTVDPIELPGGNDSMGLEEISKIVGFNGAIEMDVGPVTQALFDLRAWIGRLLRWERADYLIARHTFLPKLTDEDRERSLIPPGQPAGISRVLYHFRDEILCEIINRTVHCFWVMASERTGSGYRLWLAVYVRKLNWFTPIYMALISPILKCIIYPSMRRGIRQRWISAFPAPVQDTARTPSQLA